MRKLMMYFLFSVTVMFGMQFSLRADPGLEELVFIVHASNPSTEISASDIRDYYFKKKRRWPGGESVRFIDRGVTSHIHDLFVKNILKKSNSDVELFWIGQKLYTGDSAPLRENSDASTVQFVSSFKGAIGYVSSGATVTDPNVKTIKVLLPKKED